MTYEPGYPQQTRPMSDIEQQWLEKHGHLLQPREDMAKLPALPSVTPDPANGGQS